MKFKSVPQWCPAEGVSRSAYTSDHILKCFRAGLDRDATYWNCAQYVLLKNKAARQELANLIAQIDTMSVYAKGRIPQMKLNGYYRKAV